MSATAALRQEMDAAIVAMVARAGASHEREIGKALGQNHCARLPALLRAKRLTRLHDCVYALPGTQSEDPAVDACLSRLSETERSLVAAVDAALLEVGPSAYDKVLAGRCLFRRWTTGPKGAARIYVEIPRYPPIYAQRTDRDGLRWGSPTPGVNQAVCEEIARKVFETLPCAFSEVEALLPSPDGGVVALAGRDAHADFDPEAEEAAASWRPTAMLPCLYVESETRRLDPAKLKHPLPETVRLLVDLYEPDDIVTALRRVPQLEVVRERLEFGGYLVAGRMVFARMSPDEYYDTMREGASRFVDLLGRMRDSGMHATLLVEGGALSRRMLSINNAVSSKSTVAHAYGVHFDEPMNRADTVYRIVQAIKHHLFGVTNDHDAPPAAEKRAVRGDASRTARSMLAWIPGISEERLATLSSAFPTLLDLLHASEADLLRIPGIGPEIAQAVKAAARAPLSEGASTYK